MNAVATNREAENWVDVWIFRLADGDVLPESALTGLENKTRLGRIIPPARRRRFVFRKIVEDYVLKHYVADYRIVRSETGKPFLFGSNAPLHFSASASRDVASVAVSAAKVGADIESAASKIDLHSLCDHYALDDSSVGGHGQGPWRKTSGMWRWCRFEAALKLHGLTLHQGLSGHQGVSGRLPPHGCDRVIATPGFVCAVAQSQPFTLSRLSVMPFKRILADVA